jgi:hypothetical protein
MTTIHRSIPAIREDWHKSTTLANPDKSASWHVARMEVLRTEYQAARSALLARRASALAS